MGFYPVNPAQGIYVIGSPLFEKTVIRVGAEKTFTVEALNVSTENLYIQSATLNGQALQRAYFTHEELTAGGELVFEMGPEPNVELWSGAEAYPPSLSDGN